MRRGLCPACKKRKSGVKVFMLICFLVCESSSKLMSMNVMQLKTTTKTIFTCFTKLIVDQSPVTKFEY